MAWHRHNEPISTPDAPASARSVPPCLRSRHPIQAASDQLAILPPGLVLRQRTIRLGARPASGRSRAQATKGCAAGATALIRQVRRSRGRPWPWLQHLLSRKPPKLVALALANKIARIAWKLMTSGQSYDAAHGTRTA
jgi:hypothetical protein